jgi:hypothetical protein
MLQVVPPYINKPLPTSIAIPSKHSSPTAAKLSSSLVPMADKQIIPFGTDLNKLPPIEEPLAIIPIGEPLPLATIPPKQLALVPPKRSYG